MFYIFHTDLQQFHKFCNWFCKCKSHGKVCNKQCKPKAVVSSSYHPSLCEIGAPDPSNNRNRYLEILDAAGASSNYTPKGLFIHRLSKIIVDIITSDNFETLALSANN